MGANFKELRVWKSAMDLNVLVYKITKSFPSEERFGLTAQIRRAAVSIPSNIAEGCGRGSDAQLIYFLEIAQGSAFELETQLLLAQQLFETANEAIEPLLQTVSNIQKMISNLKKSLTVQASQS